jgi:haloacetate dehalogenase
MNVADGETLPDMLPGFTSHRIETDGASMFVRTAGSGPPLLCLHGFPQCHVMWHRIAPSLARHYTVVLPDLRGYGQSRCTDPSAGLEGEHRAHSKRVMARDMVTVMERLGHRRFLLAGHDRGGRVAYRLALDHPERVERLVTLDIVTTLDAWEDIVRQNAVGRFHWMFLARPAPFPERMIERAPEQMLDYLLSQWTGTKDLTPFDAGALAHYRHWYALPEVIHASCEDYRAGAGIDPALDAEDRAAGRKIACPMLVLWGGTRQHGFVGKPLQTWRAWCDDVKGEAIECGHFLPEEAPAETLAQMLPFLAETRLANG